VIPCFSGGNVFSSLHTPFHPGGSEPDQKYIQTYKNTSKHTKTHPNIQKHIQTYKNKSNHTKNSLKHKKVKTMFLNGTKQITNFWNSFFLLGNKQTVKVQKQNNFFWNSFLLLGNKQLRYKTNGKN